MMKERESFRVRFKEEKFDCGRDREVSREKRDRNRETKEASSRKKDPRESEERKKERETEKSVRHIGKKRKNRKKRGEQCCLFWCCIFVMRGDGSCRGAGNFEKERKIRRKNKKGPEKEKKKKTENRRRKSVSTGMRLFSLLFCINWW